MDFSKNGLDVAQRGGAPALDPGVLAHQRSAITALGVRRMLVLDADTFYRVGLRTLFETMSTPEVTECATLPQALARAAGQRYDLIVFGLDQGERMLDALAPLGRAFPEARIVLAVHRVTHVLVQQALAAGAAAVLPKASAAVHLLSVLTLVAGGGRHYELSDATRAAVAPQPAAPAPGLRVPMPPRQREVSSLLMLGLSNKEISRITGLSVGTVKNHVAAILRATGASSRWKAARLLAEGADIARAAAHPASAGSPLPPRFPFGMASAQ